MTEAVRDVVTAFHDLVLGSSCAACDSPGPALCPPCRRALVAAPFVARPTPCPPGLVPPVAAAEYADVVRTLVLAHKERGRLALARPLGDLLAASVAALLHGAGDPGGGPGVALVPVPSHPAVVRARRHDPLLRIARAAAGRLRREGTPACVDACLRVARRPGDQAGLDAGARAANVAGTFQVRQGSPRGGRATQPPRLLVLVDDVVTTGATLREAQRALEGAGIAVVGASTVAATRRRHPPSGSFPGVRVPDLGRGD